MLSEKKIEANKAEFKEIFNSLIQRDGAQDLLAYLENETDFFTAPASSQYHCSYKGGLVQHCLNVYKRLVGLFTNEYGVEKVVPDGENATKVVVDTTNDRGYTPETIAVVALLHDVCKANMYEIDYKNQKVYSPDGTKYDEKGTFDWQSVPFYRINEKLYFGHGSKSVFIIQNFMALTLEETMAIRYHMGGKENGSMMCNEDVSKPFAKFPLAVLTHLADMLATFIDEVDTDAQEN